MEENTKDILDLEYIPEEGINEPIDNNTQLSPIRPSKENLNKKAEAEDDFQLGRRLLNRSAESMERALNNMDLLGAEIQTVGFWTAYAQMITQSGILAKDLMELHQKKDSLAAFIDSPNEEKSEINIENAIVYTGTTADMQRQLKKVELDAKVPHDNDI